MISSRDVRWVAEDNVVKTRSHKIATSNFPRRDKASSKHLKSKPMTSHSAAEQSAMKSVDNTELKFDHSQQSTFTLKDLSEHDKQKIAQLIRELAKAGEEKENLMQAFYEERQKAIAQSRKMEDERLALESKQELLTEEVKRCKELLQYYQNLTFMQRASMQAQEEKLRHATPTTKRTISPSADSFHSPSGSLKVGDIKDSDESDYVDDDIHCMDMYRTEDLVSRNGKNLTCEQKCRKSPVDRKSPALDDPSTTSEGSSRRDGNLSRQSGHVQTDLASKKILPVLLRSPRSRAETGAESLSDYTVSSRIGEKSKTENSILKMPSDELHLRHSYMSPLLNKPVAMCETSLDRPRFNEFSVQLSDDDDDDSMLLQDIFFVL